MPDPDPPSPSFSGGHRWLTRINLLLAGAAVLGLLVMVNYLAQGHFKRFQLAHATATKLSPLTRRVLQSLTNDVTVTLFFDPEREADVYALASALLTEYQNVNPHHIHVAALNYVRYPGEADELLARLHLSGSKKKDFVAFESNGQSKICYALSMLHFDISDLRNIRRDAFYGERLFTSDIFDVSYPGSKKAYFLAGHGERDPGDPSGRRPSPDNSGYTKLAGILKEEVNCDWQWLVLQGTNTIPADCQLLIIASPRRGQPVANYTPNEMAQIQTYLKNNGRLFALLDQDMGLGPVLANWGVTLGERPVMDNGPDYKIGEYDFLCRLGLHPIVTPLAMQGMTIHMWAPRAVFTNAASTGPGAPQVTYIAATSEDGTNGLQRGVFPLIAAIEHGVINDRNGTRLVVAGDADFLDDQLIDDTAANHYFAVFALNWLLQRPDVTLAALGPSPIQEYKLYMTEAQTRRLYWLFLAAMPGAALFLGGLVWLRRRS